MSLQTEIILDKLRPIKEKGFPAFKENDEYLELIQSLGVSEDEWGQLQEAFYEYFQNGKSHLKDGDLKASLMNLEKALLINPNDVDTLSALSEVYLRYWQQNEDAESHHKADFFARRCLAIVPEHEASQTRIAILHPKVIVNQSSRSRAVVFILAIVILLLVGGVLAFLTLKDSASMPSTGVHY